MAPETAKPASSGARPVVDEALGAGEGPRPSIARR